MIKMAFMGAGSIAIKMASTIINMDNVKAYAIAARDLNRARAFADKYDFVKSFGSYQEMLEDKEIDLVYIATPHSHHYKCAKMALNAGKHVLCEKSFTVNADQAKKLFKLAKEKNLLITEAMWTRYMPSRKIIDEIIENKLIGDVMTVFANLGYNLTNIVRIHEPDLAGGALLDVGVYLINLARMIFKEEHISIESSTVFENGVDVSDVITMQYKNNKIAVLHSGVNAVQNRMGIIFGTDGYIEIENVNNPESIKVFDHDYRLVEQYPIPKQITGYEYEVEASIKAIKNGNLECPEMPHSETIRIMEIMDELRKSWNYDIPLIY